MCERFTDRARKVARLARDRAIESLAADRAQPRGRVARLFDALAARIPLMAEISC